MNLLTLWTESKAASITMKFCFLVILTLICSNPVQHECQLCPCLTYTQCVQSPTRVTSTTSTLIDHIYVSNPDRLIRTHVPMTSMSDRSPVCCTLSCQIPKAKAGKHTTVTYRSYKHFDAGSFLCDLINTSFDAIYGLSDPDEALAHFYELFLHVYDKHVPIRRQRVKNKLLPPWLTVDIRQAMKQRDRFKKQKNYPEFKKQRRHVKYLGRQAKKTYFKKIVSNQTDNTRLVWKALNALTKNVSCIQNIPSTLTAEVFNDHFLSLAKTLTKTLGGGGGGGVKSTNVPMNWRIFAQKGLNLMTFSSSLKLQLMKLVNMFPVLVAKLPLVVMELVIKLLGFLYHTMFNT